MLLSGTSLLLGLPGRHLAQGLREGDWLGWVSDKGTSLYLSKIEIDTLNFSFVDTKTNLFLYIAHLRHSGRMESC